MAVVSTALDVLLLATCWAHVILAPHTKVEESFNLHATHDVLMYGISSEALQSYDHFTFPGAVPRSFIGSIILARLSTPFLYVANSLHLLSSKFDIQIIVRLVLATCSALTLCLIRRGVSRRYGFQAAVWYTVFTVTQFHYPFWAGRTLPNMFALIPVNIASYRLLNRAPNSTKPALYDVKRAIRLLVFTAVVLRAEVALLLATIAAQLWWSGAVTIPDMVQSGLISGLPSLVFTMIGDSYMWNDKFLWPELYGVYFNVVLGKSADWGVSSHFQYFTTFLPKLLVGSIPFAITGAIVDHRIRSVVLPPLAFVLLLSCLGHKEWRFIIYVVPLFNIAAARGATWVVNTVKGRWKRMFVYSTIAWILVINVTIAGLLIETGMENYPGGVAMKRFHELYAGREDVHVHIGNLAAQTGATLFLHENSPPYYPAIGIMPPPTPLDVNPWIYNKTENLTVVDFLENKNITHVIAEMYKENKESALDGFESEEWEIGEVIKAFDKWTLNIFVSSWRLLMMIRGQKLIILEKRHIPEVVRIDPEVVQIEKS